VSSRTLYYKIYYGFKAEVVVNDGAYNTYVCEKALCFPIRYDGFLRWRDPSSGAPGPRVFNLDEAWDHVNQFSQYYSTGVYGGGVVWVFGAGGYLVGVHLTDYSNISPVYIARRYDADVVLITNKGDLTVRVYDPPSGYNYSVTTSGTRGSGYTDLGKNAFVMFYKNSIGQFAPLFSTAPIGMNKAYSDDCKIRYFQKDGIEVPDLYIGARCGGVDKGGDSGRTWGVFNNTKWKVAGVMYMYRYMNVNTSSYFGLYEPQVNITDYDQYGVNQMYDGGYVPLYVYVGWVEDANGNLVASVVGAKMVKHSMLWSPRAYVRWAVWYDFDRGEEYRQYFISPTSPDGLPLKDQPYIYINSDELTSSYKFWYIDPNDNLTSTTSQAGAIFESFDAYGFCNGYSTYENGIVCTQVTGIMYGDSNFNVNPKQGKVWRSSWTNDKVGGLSMSIPGWNGKTMKQGLVYGIFVRLKRFDSTVSDDVLKKWFTSFKLTSFASFDKIYVPPYAYVAGMRGGYVKISAPSSVVAGSAFTVTVEDVNSAGKPFYVFVLDEGGNVAQIGEGTLNSSGVGQVQMSIPKAGRYRVVGVVVGNRTL